jgi:hypothetical protein
MSLAPRSRVRPSEPAPEKPKFRRVRCPNCDKKFEKTKPNRKFCSTQCKNEYARHGSAFGPLKTRITTMIDRRVKELTDKKFAELLRRIQTLEANRNTIEPV